MTELGLIELRNKNVYTLAIHIQNKIVYTPRINNNKKLILCECNCPLINFHDKQFDAETIKKLKMILEIS